MENQEKKTRSANRTHDEMIEELDKKIAYHHIQISQLEAKKVELNQPRKERKLSMKAVLDDAKDAGLTPEEIKAILEEAKRHKTEQATA